MKKILFIFAGILISNNLFSQIQFTKDTIYFEGNGVGYVSDLVSEERTITSQTGKDIAGRSSKKYSPYSNKSILKRECPFSDDSQKYID